MSTALVERHQVSAAIQEKVLLGGDLGALTPVERVNYYKHLCESLNLNPLTRPFEYMILQGKTVLYARKDCTEQLRSTKNISIEIVGREVVNGVYIVTSRARTPEGRTDEAIGAVPFDEKMSPIDRANAVMKAETKSKRRVTLSIAGLGFTDESELETIPNAKPIVMSEEQDIADEPYPLKVNIPQVRPQVGDRDLSAPASGDVPPAETAVPPVLPAGAPIQSAKDRAMQIAQEHEESYLLAEGYVGSYTPRGSTEKSPPGKFILETLSAELEFQFWKKPDGMGEAGHSYARVQYQEAVYRSKTQRNVVKVEWIEPPK